MTDYLTEPAEQILRSRFGLAEFRPGQQQVVEAVLAGHDALCIMPTGGGKSLCFQLPAVARPGVVLVISPLIALMKDQVDVLQQRGIAATFINSSLNFTEQQARGHAMVAGEYDLVYLAPERLRNSSFFEQLMQTDIQLLAIDEAHCISQWGHDFRPDYAKIGRARRRLGNLQTMALTATATSHVRQDIIELLGLRDPAVFVTGFARDNLALAINEMPSQTDKDRMLTEFLSRTPGSGIVYASTRKACEHIDEHLRQTTRRRVGFYHAGLEAEERSSIQEQFIKDQLEVIVATNAFGMGVDKPNVRFVVHYNLPGSIEAYYQEAGRAGRDGLPAACLLMHGYRDRFIQEFFIENNYPSAAIIQSVYEYLCSIDADPIELTLQEIKDDLGVPIGAEGIRVCENVLEKCGALERLDQAQNMASIRINSQLPSIVDLLPREAKVQRRIVRELERLIGPLKNERVYFHPADIAAKLDLSTEALARGLRALSSLDVVDYVKPFRGRAVHLLNRHRSFEQLEIDFAELEKRKNSEYARLDQVIRFAKTNECRQLAILNYFGDPDARQCGRCDNCLQFRSQLERTFDDADRGCLYLVQVILSGVVRSQGRAGKNLIAQMLAGSQAKKLKGLGLHRLSTFGMLRQMTQTEIQQLIDPMIESGLLTSEEIQKFRPVVKLTTQGREVMHGRSFPDFEAMWGPRLRALYNHLFAAKQPQLPDATPPASKNDAEPHQPAPPTPRAASQNEPSGVTNDPPVPVDSRTASSDEPPGQTNVPAESASPQSPNQDISDDGPDADTGVGLTAATHSETATATAISQQPGSALPEDPPDWYWTWFLLEQDLTAAQVTHIRRKSIADLESDLRKAREAGFPMQSEPEDSLEQGSDPGVSPPGVSPPGVSPPGVDGTNADSAKPTPHLPMRFKATTGRGRGSD